MQIKELLEVMRDRRSSRGFLTGDIDDEQINNILEAARWAPSGVNSQPWHLIVVRAADARRRIVDVYRQGRGENEGKETDGRYMLSTSYLYQAPVLIVVCYDPRLRRAFGGSSRGVTMLFSVAAAIENMFLAASALGLGAAWISIRRSVALEIKEILEIPAAIEIACMMPLGHASYHVDGQRQPLAQMVHYDGFDQSRLIEEADLPEVIGTIHQRRNLIRVEEARLHAAAVAGKQQE